MKHFGIIEHDMFYNNTPAKSLPLGKVLHPDPNNIEDKHKKLGIQSTSTSLFIFVIVFVDA